jgi:CubicO group peptidase (beta-lactamase class C family)
MGAAPLAASATLAAGGTAHADSGTSSSSRVPDELRPGGELDRYIARLAAEDKFSGTVLLTYKGRTVLERAHGMADQARSIRNVPGTLFNLGSNTKMFTGVAIGQLAQQGKLRYDDRVGTHLDGFAPELADKVTIHQLLTHTSGAGDYHQMKGFFEEARTWTSVEQAWNGVMTYVRKEKPAFPPGSRSSYSNSGYVILGAIVAELSGQSYYDYIREHVFAPARMATAAFSTIPECREDPRIAHPYATSPSGGREDALDRHLYVGMPAGGSFASTGDMARFTDALQHDKLLDPAIKFLHFSPKSPLGPPRGSEDRDLRLGYVGYGTLVNLAIGQWVFGHGGGSPGVNASLAWYPDTNWTAVVHSNYDDGARGIADLAQQLITKSR